MHHRWLGLISVCLVTVGTTAPVWAESAWKLPSLNPFASKSAKDRAANKSSGFAMPKLLPSWGKSKKRSSSQPSTWNKITTETKQIFEKTADVLTPWDNNTGSRNKKTSFSQRFQMGGAEKKKQKKSFFTGWLPEKEEVQKPRSVSEFLKQPRPTP